eukprot:15323800-Ditylum_brightwellii.AAC.1
MQLLFRGQAVGEAPWGERAAKDIDKKLASFSPQPINTRLSSAIPKLKDELQNYCPAAPMIQEAVMVTEPPSVPTETATTFESGAMPSPFVGFLGGSCILHLASSHSSSAKTTPE